MTTSEAIEVLKQKKKYLMKKQLKRAIHKRASLSPVVPDIIRALGKAIEVMGRLKNIEQAIEETARENPYKVRGDHSTYTQYNEGWSDACDILGERIKEVIK